MTKTASRTEFLTAPFLTLIGSIADGYGALWGRAVGYRC